VREARRASSLAATRPQSRCRYVAVYPAFGDTSADNYVGSVPVVVEGCVVRIYRSRPLMGWTGFFHVLIDGVDRGELWPKQVGVFEVSPGDHRLELRRGVSTRSKVMEFSVKSGEVTEFACSRLATAVGLTGLHRATQDESDVMKNLVAPSPTPRDLSAPE